MPHFVSPRQILVFFLLLAGFLVPAFAQESKPAPADPTGGAAPPKVEKSKPATPAAPAKAAQGPVATTAFGAWALRCMHGDTPNKACEISQTIESKDHGAIAKISIGRPQGAEAYHIAIILPNNVSFPSSVHLRTETNDKWGLTVDWARCIPGGCFAEATLGDATLAHWHGLDVNGNIVFQNAAGDEVALPMSFHGFGQALDALKK